MSDPLVAITETLDGRTEIRLCPKDLNHYHYAMIICDLIRHTVAAFAVSEHHLFKGIKEEFSRPTTGHKFGPSLPNNRRK